MPSPFPCSPVIRECSPKHFHMFFVFFDRGSSYTGLFFQKSQVQLFSFYSIFYFQLVFLLPTSFFIFSFVFLTSNFSFTSNFFFNFQVFF